MMLKRSALTPRAAMMNNAIATMSNTTDMVIVFVVSS